MTEEDAQTQAKIFNAEQEGYVRGARRRQVDYEGLLAEVRAQLDAKGRQVADLEREVAEATEPGTVSEVATLRWELRDMRRLYETERELRFRLGAKVEAMREALAPMAALLCPHHDTMKDWFEVYSVNDKSLTIGDLRRAKAALSTDIGKRTTEQLELLAECERVLTMIRGRAYDICCWPIPDEVGQIAKAIELIAGDTIICLQTVREGKVML